VGLPGFGAGLYWWPVWAVGLLLAGLTWLDGHHLAIVPGGTQVVEGFDGGREALVLPTGAHLPRDPGRKPRQAVRTGSPGLVRSARLPRAALQLMAGGPFFRKRAPGSVWVARLRSAPRRPP
jgi:hypothetical protein